MSDKVYKVYQIRQDNERSDQAYRALALKGSQGYEQKMDECFDQVCVVSKASGLNFVFEVLNCGDDDLFDDHVSGYTMTSGGYRNMHSLSVGDIVSDGQESWMVDPVGFTKINFSKEVA